jgi:hypothetical protein
VMRVLEGKAPVHPVNCVVEQKRKM